MVDIDKILEDIYMSVLDRSLISYGCNDVKDAILKGWDNNWYDKTNKPLKDYFINLKEYAIDNCDYNRNPQKYFSNLIYYRVLFYKQTGKLYNHNAKKVLNKPNWISQC